MTQDVPSGWGKDSLSHFFQSAYENCLVAFHRGQEIEFKTLERIDLCFNVLLQSNSNNKISLFPFLHRSHSAFRASAYKAMSGQVADVYPTLRSLLEYALYSCLIAENPDLAKIFYKRSDSEKAKRKVRQVFKISNCQVALGRKREDLQLKSQQLYDDSINFGAHPNELSIVSSLKIEEDRLDLVYLHAGDHPMHHTLKKVKEFGITTLLIYKVLLPDLDQNTEVAGFLNCWLEELSNWHKKSAEA